MSRLLNGHEADIAGGNMFFRADIDVDLGETRFYDTTTIWSSPAATAPAQPNWTHYTFVIALVMQHFALRGSQQQNVKGQGITVHWQGTIVSWSEGNNIKTPEAQVNVFQLEHFSPTVCQLRFSFCRYVHQKKMHSQSLCWYFISLRACLLAMQIHLLFLTKSVRF